MQPIGKGGGGQWAAVVIALTLIASLSDDVGLLLCRLDAFGNDLHIKAATQLDDGANDGCVVFVNQDILNEAAVDLDLVQRQAAQVTERGVAGTKIVDCNLHAGLFQAVEMTRGG